MNPKYLLTCECGAVHPVATRNAGETLTCDCRRALPIPTLREIRNLPVAPETDSAPTRPRWTLGRGLLYATTLPLFLACLGLIGRAEYLRRLVPAQAMETPSLELVLKRHPDPLIQADIDSMTPWQTIEQLWRPTLNISILARQMPNHLQARQFSQDMAWREKWACIGAAIFGAMLLLTLLTGRR